MSDLFAVAVSTISKHLKNIFDFGELVSDSVVSILETTAAKLFYNFIPFETT